MSVFCIKHKGTRQKFFFIQEMGTSSHTYVLWEVTIWSFCLHVHLKISMPFFIDVEQVFFFFFFFNFSKSRMGFVKRQINLIIHNLVMASKFYINSHVFNYVSYIVSQVMNKIKWYNYVSLKKNILNKKIINTSYSTN